MFVLPLKFARMFVFVAVELCNWAASQLALTIVTLNDIQGNIYLYLFMCR